MIAVDLSFISGPMCILGIFAAIGVVLARKGLSSKQRIP